MATFRLFSADNSLPVSVSHPCAPLNTVSVHSASPVLLTSSGPLACLMGVAAALCARPLERTICRRSNQLVFFSRAPGTRNLVSCLNNVRSHNVCDHRQRKNCTEFGCTTGTAPFSHSFHFPGQVRQGFPQALPLRTDFAHFVCVDCRCRPAAHDFYFVVQRRVGIMIYPRPNVFTHAVALSSLFCLRSAFVCFPVPTLTCSYPGGNFGQNQLPGSSMSLSPLVSFLASDLHVNRVANFHRSFPRLCCVRE